MSLAHPTSLANAIAAAEEIELAVHSSRRPIAHAQHSSGQKTASYNTGNKGARSKGRWYRDRGGNRGGTNIFQEVVEAKVDATAVIDVKMDAEVKEPDLQ